MAPNWVYERTCARSLKTRRRSIYFSINSFRIVQWMSSAIRISKNMGADLVEQAQNGPFNQQHIEYAAPMLVYSIGWACWSHEFVLNANVRMANTRKLTELLKYVPAPINNRIKNFVSILAMYVERSSSGR